ncbi:hypothetical protein NL676_012256 [Syzygium grande]|nr:hypothetical protein NL676_012256 [Syzygium grande]
MFTPWFLPPIFLKIKPLRYKGSSRPWSSVGSLDLGLVSWNSVLTIGDYYYEVFPNYHPSRVLTLVYQPFAIGTMAILAYHESRVDTRKRNVAGYILFTLSTLFLIVLDLATSGKGGVGPYFGLCVLVACFGVADAHVEGGMVGDLSFMYHGLSSSNYGGFSFVQSYFAGLAGLRLITKAAFEKAHDGLRKGAMLFLAISTFFEFICIILYATWFANIPVVKYYRSKAASEGSKSVSADLVATGIQTQDGDSKEDRLSNKQLLFQNIDYAIDIYLIYVLTLTIFPGFLYENTGTHQLGSCLMIAILAHFLLVPAFYFTAKYGDQGWMIMLISFLGLSNGYLTVCVTTVASKGYKGPEQNALGNLLVLFLLGGIFSGVALGWLWIIGNGALNLEMQCMTNFSNVLSCPMVEMNRI